MSLGRLFWALPVLGLAVACGASSTDDANKGNDAFSEKQSSGRSLPPKTLALTFDDGPGARTKELSGWLKDQGIAAGFFMLGNAAKGHEDILKQVNADGHVIGNHTWDHKLLTKLSIADAESEIRKTDEVVSPFFKDNMRMFRAPFGGWSPAIADHMNKTDLSKYVGSIFWDEGGELTATHAADWACWGQAKLSIQECGNRYIQEIHDRGDKGIVLMHDIHSNTIDMVKLIVPMLKQQGFKFVRVDQVPDIHDQLVANGATPGADVGVAATGAAPHDCDTEGMLCGDAVGKDPKTLFNCNKGTLRTSCTCAGACSAGACDCASGEPGAPEN